MDGPHAVLVVDGPDHRPETGRTQFPALPLNFTAIRQAVPLDRNSYFKVAPLGATKHRANSPELMTCRHLEYARHAGAAGLFSQQDQKPYLNQAKCKARGGEGAEWRRSARGKRTCRNKLVGVAIGRAPPFH